MQTRSEAGLPTLQWHVGSELLRELQRMSQIQRSPARALSYPPPTFLLTRDRDPRALYRHAIYNKRSLWQWWEVSCGAADDCVLLASHMAMLE